MSDVRIVQAGPRDGVRVVEQVRKLLVELGAVGAGIEDFTAEELAGIWGRDGDRHTAFLALNADGEAVGVATAAATFALYAGGRYGVVNELYVAPEVRSDGVGAALLEAVRVYGRSQGWRRIELTGPEDERFARTIRFYEREGFAFTGPQMKQRLTGSDSGREKR